MTTLREKIEKTGFFFFDINEDSTSQLIYTCFAIFIKKILILMSYPS